MMEDDVGLDDVGRGRLLAVRLFGACFAFLGGIAALAGFFWVLSTFRSDYLVSEETSGLTGMLRTVVVPVAASVAGTWLLFGIGRGLRRGSRLARRAAVGLLVPACVPPLVLFFHAIRAGVPAGAVLALVLLTPSVAGTLLLTSWKTDAMFRPKGLAILEGAELAATAPRSAVGFLLKLVLIVFALVATLVLFATTQSS